MRRVWILLIVAAAALGQSSSQIEREGHYWVQTSSDVVPAPPSGRLGVSVRGPVAVQGVADNRIVYSLKKRVRAGGEAEAQRLLGEFAVRTKTADDWTWLVVTHPDRGNGVSELELKVPRSLRHCVLGTTGGAVEAYSLDGEVGVKTVGGQVRMDGIGGNVTVRTGGGEVHLGKIGGSLRCASGGGTIHAEHVGGEAFVETAGGEIFVREARGPVHASATGGNIRVERAASTVTANTGGGLIDIVQAGGPVKAESAAGFIRVASVTGARLESAAGTIQLRGVTGALRVSTASGNILAELLSKGRLEDSSLSTSSGDVTVLIPSNLAVTIQALNEGAGRLGRIVSEFPEIQVRVERTRGSRPAVAEGELNGGGPLLQISAAGGTIYLRRQR